MQRLGIFLRSALRREKFPTQYGGGQDGDKVTTVYSHADEICAAGARLPPNGFVLQTGFFDRFMEGPYGMRTKLPELRALSQDGHDQFLLQLSIDFTSEQMSFLSIIAKQLRGKVIAIRPSLVGESRGVGVTQTELVYLNGTFEQDLQKLQRAVQKAFFSTFSKNTQSYLERKGIDLQAALWILPVVGRERIREVFDGFSQTITGQFFYPEISGCGYTRYLDAQAKMAVANGFGSRAVDGVVRPILFDMQTLGAIRAQYRDLDAYDSSAEVLRRRRAAFSERDCYLNSGLVSAEYDAGHLFRSTAPTLLQLGDQLGNTFYMEFATEDASVPVPVILQLSRALEFDQPVFDIKQRCDDFSQIGFSDEVIGIGKITSQKILFIGASVNGDDVQLVEKFNRENKGYVLVATPDLLYNPARRGGCLSFHHICNAAAIIENNPGGWRSDMRTLDGHARGLLADSGILLISLALNPERLLALTDINVLSVQNAVGQVVVERPITISVDERVTVGEIRLSD